MRKSEILRELDDLQMVQFMGRENLEDYKADFLAMLNAWEAMSNVLEDCRHPDDDEVSDARIAKELGWVREKAKRGVRYSGPNATAEACASASRMFRAPGVKRSDFTGLTGRSVRILCQRASSRLDAIEKQADQYPPAEVERVKRQIGEAVRVTADQPVDVARHHACAAREPQRPLAPSPDAYDAYDA